MQVHTEHGYHPIRISAHIMLNRTGSDAHAHTNHSQRTLHCAAPVRTVPPTAGSTRPIGAPLARLSRSAAHRLRGCVRHSAEPWLGRSNARCAATQCALFHCRQTRHSASASGLPSGTRAPAAAPSCSSRERAQPVGVGSVSSPMCAARVRDRVQQVGSCAQRRVRATCDSEGFSGTSSARCDGAVVRCARADGGVLAVASRRH
jgi:hypothetical protein